MKITAVLFDFIGTTVMEREDAINMAFEDAFRSSGITVDSNALRQNRGKDKRELIDTLLVGSNHTAKNRERIYASFHTNVKNSLDKFALNPGTLTVLAHLRKKEIKIGLGSGLARDLFELIFDRLLWDKTLFDYIGIAKEVGKGRPSPDMIFDMMKLLNVSHADEFLKIGDTAADIMEGKNAGVKTAVLLSGTQPESALRQTHPDFVLNKLEELASIL